MGFQSVLIYFSPWGLLSVVICLWLGWHDLCPSCFRPCIPSKQDNPRSSITSLTWLPEQYVVMKTERECRSAVDPEESALCCCAFPIFQLLRVFIALRRWKWEISRRHDKVSVAALFDARVHEKKKENKTFNNHISVAWNAVSLWPFLFLHFLFFPLCFCNFAFYPFLSHTLSYSHFLSLSLYCMSAMALPIGGLYCSLVLHKYTLSHLQFHALEPFYLCAWWLLRELILILIRRVRERERLSERNRELPPRAGCRKEWQSCRRGPTPET